MEDQTSTIKILMKKVNEIDKKYNSEKAKRAEFEYKFEISQ